MHCLFNRDEGDTGDRSRWAIGLWARMMSNEVSRCRSRALEIRDWKMENKY